MSSIFLVLASLWAAAPAPSVRAASIQVSNNHDSGSGSLRQAADDAAPGDTLAFAPALSGQTITLLSPIAISKDLTIDGSSLATPITIRGGGGFQVFVISSGTIHLNSLSITMGGAAGSGSGGGIAITGGSVSLDGCLLRDNYALQGGAIYNGAAGTLSVTGTTITHNHANWGNGIYNAGVLTISGSQIIDNDGGISPGAYGGGITNTGTLVVTRSTFSGNLAYGNGGGIQNTGNLTVTDSVFTDNESGSGAGIYNNSIPSKNILINHNLFSGNSGLMGAGIYNNVNGDVTLSDNVFSGNTVNDTGAGIYNRGVMTVQNNSITGNSSSNEGGGGLYNQGTLSLLNSTVSDNYSSWGGGLYNRGSLTAANSTIVGNSSGFQGGGILNEVGNMKLSNVTLSGNLSLYSDYGGVYNQASLIMANTILADSAGGDMDCYNELPGMTIQQASLIETNAAGPFSCAAPAFTGDPMLASLADIGGTPIGPSDTDILHPFALSPQTGSPAIDAGNGPACAAIGGKDQRGVTRPVGSGCDLGSVEMDPIPQVSLSGSSPANGASLSASLASLTVAFDQNMNAASAQNSDNYLLVSAGANAAFDTHTCKSGLASDDVKIPTGPVVYDASSRSAAVTVNGGSELPDGSYRLFVCGTTSITDQYGLKINYGLSDTTLSFTIAVPAASNPSKQARALPATGFAPGRKTELFSQPPELAYSGSSLTLKIPTLGLESSITGVPRTQAGWDLSWLGGQIGYLEGTAFPTTDGNAVLTGHVYGADGQPGPFVDLHKLKWGDAIWLRAWGKDYIYVVRSVDAEVQPRDTAALDSPDDLSRLTLITCRGFDENSGQYLLRVVVQAVLVEIRQEE